MAFIKNIDHEKVLNLASQITAAPGQIVSKTLAQNKAVSLTLFAFSKGEEISTHAAGGDAMMLCLEGEGVITNEGVPHTVQQGESFSFRPGAMHKVAAVTRFKMMVMIVRN